MLHLSRGHATLRVIVVAGLLTLGLSVVAAPAGATKRHENICVNRAGKLHLRTACGSHERRLDVSRARGASGGAVITTCVNKKGQLKVVSRSKKCKRGEKRLTWAVEGKPGPKGEQGPPGLKGEQGLKGNNGENGLSEATVHRSTSEVTLSEKEWKEVPGLQFDTSAHEYAVDAVVNLIASAKKETGSDAVIECRLSEEYPEREGPEFHILTTSTVSMTSFYPVFVVDAGNVQITLQTPFFPEPEDKLRVECKISSEVEMNSVIAQGGYLTAVEVNTART